MFWTVFFLIYPSPIHGVAPAAPPLPLSQRHHGARRGRAETPCLLLPPRALPPPHRVLFRRCHNHPMPPSPPAAPIPDTPVSTPPIIRNSSPNPNPLPLRRPTRWIWSILPRFLLVATLPSGGSWRRPRWRRRSARVTGEHSQRGRVDRGGLVAFRRGGAAPHRRCSLLHRAQLVRV